jgi:hypothetical protein
MFKVLETIPKVLAWLQIAIAPLVVGGVAGFFIYAYNTHVVGLVLAILRTVIGLVLGIVWANRVEKNKCVIAHMARVIATPELNHPEDSIHN